MDTGLEKHRAECLLAAQRVLARLLKDTSLTQALDPENPAYLLVTYPGGRLHYDYFNGWVRAFPSARSAVYSLCLHQGSTLTWSPEHVALHRVRKLVKDAGLEQEKKKTLT